MAQAGDIGASAARLHVTGIVQGVGMRPTVYNLAKSQGLCGWVLNAIDGVHIHVEGPAGKVQDFARLLRDSAPAAARIDEVSAQSADVQGFEGFEIRESGDAGETATFVSPDLATCDDCLRELFDPSDRRYRYPFINCTSCGPRFTIIKALPYDRPRTSMSGFEMCSACEREYEDPGDRRFDAQPNACFCCGPQLLFWETPHGTALPGALSQRQCEPIAADPHAHGQASSELDNRAQERSDAIIERTAELLKAGRIVAIKGLGGFHLACDATSESAVEALRQRKHRPTKPLAVMVADAKGASEVCSLSSEEKDLLESKVRPIVLLELKPAANAAASIAPNVTCGLPELGVMLPATPLQHLLMRAVGSLPLVMTSGNISGEPIAASNFEALEKLAPIADAILGNDRPILSRYDDSVMRCRKFDDGREEALVIRRARGLAPLPLPLPSSLSQASATPVLATGPEQKATIAMASEDKVFVSQHIGDLENAATEEAFAQTVFLYERLFFVEPRELACDMHPRYRSSAWAREQAAERELPLREVQHHHAHIAAVMAENDERGRVVGLALDGTGAGTDGTIWGGEVLVCDMSDFARVAHLSLMPLPGGEAAIRNPLRMAESLLLTCGLAEHPQATRLRGAMAPGEWETVETMIARGVNCPATSSAGRLLDAISALLGICPKMTYDGEPAIALDAHARRAAAAAAACAASACAASGSGPSASCAASAPATPVDPAHHYEFAFCDPAQTPPQAQPQAPSQAPSQARDAQQALSQPGAMAQTAAHKTQPNAKRFEINPAPAIKALLDDMETGVSSDELALRFMRSFAHAMAQAAIRTARAYELDTVALGGGVFMSSLLLDEVDGELRASELKVITSRELPANDGCISYGQAIVALARRAKAHDEGDATSQNTDRRGL